MTPKIIRAFAEASLRTEGTTVTEESVSAFLCGYASGLLSHISDLERSVSTGYRRTGKPTEYAVDPKPEPKSL